MAYESETPGVARKALTLLAGLVLAAALVAGCGGGSDEADQTRSDFIVEADAICGSSMSRGCRFCAAPRYVFIVRSPSGVTST